MNILSHIENHCSHGKKLLARLIDPDDISCLDELIDLARRAEQYEVDYLFFGGSLITTHLPFNSVEVLRQTTRIPVVLFPSSPMQINPHAHAMLFLSLISGRNPEFLIGHHVVAAPAIRAASLETIPTGYMLVNCGAPTTAHYISHSLPLPYNKPEIAAATALAGEMLGLKLIYLDGGSGAEKPVSPGMVSAVRKTVGIPLIVGGGIRSAKDAINLYEAGADMLVVGNSAEENPMLIEELSLLRKN